MLSCFGHQSRFEGVPPENGHLLWSSMIISSWLGAPPRTEERNLRNAIHQVKLTLMIATIRLSDDKCDPPTTSLLRRIGTSRPFRARRRGLRDLATGALDADPGDGGCPRRCAAGAQCPAGRADPIRRGIDPAGARYPAFRRRTRRFCPRIAGPARGPAAGRYDPDHRALSPAQGGRESGAAASGT